jgi:hypothetical protein
MYEIAVLLTVFLMIVSALDYVRRAWIGETNPVPATWILMVTMFSLSCWMYWESPKKSWTGNIALTSGLVNVVIILVGVIASNVRYGTLKIAFDSMQKWCIMGGFMVVIFWSITSKSLASLLPYILVQCIALIAYIATVKRLWLAEKSTEPLFLWVAVLLASFCAIYPAISKQDVFAWVYLARAIPSTGIIIYLIVRIKKRMKLHPSVYPR